VGGIENQYHSYKSGLQFIVPGINYKIHSMLVSHCYPTEKSMTTKDRTNKMDFH